MKKRKQHICTNEYIIKKTSKKDSASFYVILPKKQLLKRNKKEGDVIILEMYEWVDE